jgi:hypothetical protein
MHSTDQILFISMTKISDKNFCNTGKFEYDNLRYSQTIILYEILCITNSPDNQHF